MHAATDQALRSQANPHARLLSRVVVAFDGSDSANAAVAFGLWLAGKAGSATTILHASPTPEDVPTADLLPLAAEQVVDYEADWHRRLENVRAYAAEGADVRTGIVRGHAAGALIAAAIEERADLLLTGSHGVGRLRGALLGSVSSQLLDHAPSSVMIFPESGLEHAASHARTVLVGIDGSSGSHRALELAQALAVPLGATLTLVHVYNPVVPFASSPMTSVREELQRHGTKVLHEARNAIAAPLETVDEELLEGQPREQLVRACEHHSPALLVVGTRGLGGFRELLLGSTSKWAANHAPCPVVVAREPEHAE